MKITIIGAGNIGTLMAAEMAHKGHVVTVYTSRPERWNRIIEVLDESDYPLMIGKISKVTNDLRVAVDGAELIWIVIPSMMFEEVGRKLESVVKHGQLIGVVPGSGGAEFAFKGCINKGCTLFGLQRVHSISRLKEYGKSVYMLGRKDKLYIGAIPSNKAGEICSLVETLFDMPCISLKNYLAVTLTPSNPILHTSRIYSMFKKWEPGVVYDRNFLFYEEWDTDSSAMLIACDSEEQELCGTIPLVLDEVVSLKTYYESQDATAMTNKISGIKAFKGLLSPMKEVEEGWIPDFSSRYFTADFSYGLKIIKDIAGLFDVKTPNIDMVWNWYVETSKPEKWFDIGDIKKIEFVNIY